MLYRKILSGLGVFYTKTAHFYLFLKKILITEKIENIILMYEEILVEQLKVGNRDAFDALYQIIEIKKFLIIGGKRFVIIYGEAFSGEELIACEYGRNAFR